MKVPYHKPHITEDEIGAVVDTLRSGWITMGPKTLEFEERFREQVGSEHAVSVSSCTAALHLALKAVGLGALHEVIVPALTFTATAEVVTYFNAKPVLVDVDPVTCNIDVSKLEAAITPMTRAIIPVHYGGQPCDMDEIMDIAAAKGLAVVEDAAHALPAEYKGRKVGTLGDFTCFSFYATKTLATGEGGMVTTNDGAAADKVRSWRLHGLSLDAWKRNDTSAGWQYEVLDAGYKYNMTDLQASMGLVQLKKLEMMRELRASIASRYHDAFGPMDEMLLPEVGADRKSAWHLYPVQLKLEALQHGRNRFIQMLGDAGVGASVHFIPLHMHPYYQRAFGYEAHGFDGAEHAYERLVSLPIYPSMTDEEIDYVIQTVVMVLNKLKR